MRKLAIVSVSFSLATFLSHFLLSGKWIPVFAAFFIITVLYFWFCRVKIRSCRYYPLFFALSLMGFTFGIWNYGIHQVLTVNKARTMNDTEQTMLVQLVEDPLPGDRYDRIHVKIADDRFPRLDIMLYDYNHSMLEQTAGERFLLSAKLRSSDTRYGEKNDYYISRNIYLTGTLRSGWELKEHRVGLFSLAAKIKSTIKRECESVFPENIKPFMKALLLGDKSEFYSKPSLYTAVSRAGMMHMVAVSGMHIAFLVGLLQMLLGTGKRTSFLCLIILWLFVFVTGASPSAVRAGIMQTILLMAPVLRRENDSITSLSFALMWILILNPFSCASVSLQLSFGAMAGILFFGESVSDYLLSLFPKRNDNRFMQSLCRTAGASLSVMVFSIPLTAIHFGYLSLYSPLSNIASLGAVSICFSAGLLACMAAVFCLPLGYVFGWISTLFARYLIAVSSIISRLPGASVYLNSKAFVIWLFLCYLFALLAVLWKTKSAWRMIIPVVLSFFSLFSVSEITRLNYQKPDGFLSVLDVGQGECVCVLAEGNTLLFDCGSTGGFANAGETAASFLKATGRKQVDALILSHLHEDHANGVPMLLELIPVKQIYVLEEADCIPSLQREIDDAVDQHHVEQISLTDNAELDFGNIHVDLFLPSETGDQNERCMISKVSIGQFDALITGDAPKSSEISLLADHPLDSVEVLVAGHHGSRTSTSGDLLDAMQGDTAIISCGLNAYGHPSYEVLERLDAYGYRIYRTDLQGTVEIRIRNGQ